MPHENNIIAKTITDFAFALKFVIVHCGTNNVGKDGPVDIVNALFLKENCNVKTS